MVGDADRAPSLCCSGRCEASDRPDLGQLAEVLGCGGEVELVFCSVWTAQAQAIQFQDAFEVGEQHLDLLPLATGDEESIAGGDLPG